MIEVSGEQAKDKVWSEVISWIEIVQIPEKKETQGKSREGPEAHSMFDPVLFKLVGGVFVYERQLTHTKAAE